MTIITQFHIPKESFLFACNICEQSDSSICYDILRSFGRQAMRLIELKAFTTSANPIIEDANDNEVEIIYKNGKPVYFDPESKKWIELSYEQICQYSLKFDWILGIIAKDLNIHHYLTEEIVKDSLWKVGIFNKATPVFFTRRINYRSIFSQIYGALEKRKSSAGGIILTTSPFLPLGCDSIAGHKIVSLHDCLVHDNNFHIDLDIIKTAVGQVVKKEGFSSGYRRAYFNSIEYSFTKKQSAVIEALDKHGSKVNKDELLAEADSEQYDLYRIFKDNKGKYHAAWNILIKNDGKGNYWLDY